MKLGKAFLIGCVAALSLLPSAAVCQDLNIGVLANRGKVAALKEWKATADYLSAHTGRTFTIVALDYDQLPGATRDKQIDFVLTNSAMYAEYNKLYGIEAIATQVNQHQGQPLDKFSSTIVVKANSPIANLSDLKNKDFACASRSAFGGWLMTVRLLLENGIDPNRDLKSLRELKTHDNVIWAVLNGAVAAGSVRTGILEKMIQEGKIKATDLKLVHQENDGFPLLHSTQLYAEYPFAACRHVPPELKNAVAKALIEIKPSDKAALDTKIIGWKEPLDYAPVVECLVAIKYGAFGKNAQAPVPAPASTQAPAQAQAKEAENSNTTSIGPLEQKPPVRTSKGRGSN